jgi:hypothetical protein
MKKSLIWTTITVGVIGVGVPAFAAVQTNKPLPSINTVQNKVEDISGPCDEAEHANDPRCATVLVEATQATTANTTQATPVTQPSNTVDDSTRNSTSNSTDDNSTSNSIDDSTSNSIDDSTSNSIDDISGPCDEAEHANDPRCTGAPAPADDSSGSGGSDDSGHHGGGDDSGHGGDDD